MESKVNYTAVGLFVVILSAALIGLGLWIGADISPKDYRRYDAFFNESVSGLNANAPVKYRGVTVGRVSHIQLSPDNPQLRLIYPSRWLPMPRYQYKALLVSRM